MKLLFLIVFALTLASCSEPTVVEVGECDLDWRVGTVLSYQQLDLESGEMVSTPSIEIDEVTTMDGYQVFRANSAHYRMRSGLFEVMIRDSDTFFDWRQVASCGHKKGDTVSSWDFVRTSDNGVVLDTVTQYLVVETTDTTIQIPAGTFKCQVVRDGMDNFFATLIYFSPGVGIVKYDSYEYIFDESRRTFVWKLSAKEELVSFHR